MSAATFLAYVDAVPGRLYPLVPTLVELTARDHRVLVRCGIDDIGRLRSLGLKARPSSDIPEPSLKPSAMRPGGLG